MPEMDGLEATRRILRALARGRAAADRRDDRQGDEGDRERCLAAGMDDYLTKPIRVDELVAAIKRTPAAAGPSRPRRPTSIRSTARCSSASPRASAATRRSSPS